MILKKEANGQTGRERRGREVVPKNEQDEENEECKNRGRYRFLKTRRWTINPSTFVHLL